MNPEPHSFDRVRLFHSSNNMKAEDQLETEIKLIRHCPETVEPVGDGGTPRMVDEVDRGAALGLTQPPCFWFIASNRSRMV
jgi:hypothetical protein